MLCFEWNFPSCAWRFFFLFLLRHKWLHIHACCTKPSRPNFKIQIPDTIFYFVMSRSRWKETCWLKCVVKWSYLKRLGMKNKLPFCLILKIAKLNYIISFKKIYTITGIAGIIFTLSLFEWKRLFSFCDTSKGNILCDVRFPSKDRQLVFWHGVLASEVKKSAITPGETRAEEEFFFLDFSHLVLSSHFSVPASNSKANNTYNAGCFYYLC